MRLSQINLTEPHSCQKCLSQQHHRETKHKQYLALLKKVNLSIDLIVSLLSLLQGSLGGKRHRYDQQLEFLVSYP